MRFRLTNYDYYDGGCVTSKFEVDAPTAEQGEIMIKKQLSKLLRNYPAGQLFVSPIQAGLPQGWQDNLLPNTSEGSPALPGSNGQGWQTAVGIGEYIPNNGGIGINLPNNGEWSTITVDGTAQSPTFTATGGLQLEPGATVMLTGFNSAGLNGTYVVTNSSSQPMSFQENG